MAPLTDHQRQMLTRRVARSLAWAGLGVSERDSHMWRAKIIVQDLEETGVSGASLKRAVERVLDVPAQPETEAANA